MKHVAQMQSLRPCLRPCLKQPVKYCLPTKVVRAYTSFGNAFRPLFDRAIIGSKNQDVRPSNLDNWHTSHSRCFSDLLVTPVPVQEHESNSTEHKLDARWPRLVKPSAPVKSCREFHQSHRALARGQTEVQETQVRGRVWSIRTAGNKLAFVDLMQDNVKLQAVFNYRDLGHEETQPEELKNFVHNLKRGDIISVIGNPHRTPRNELSILLSKVPLLLSSCVRPLPIELKNEESKMRLRHVDLLLRPETAQILKLGSDIKKFLRIFLEQEGHISVKTPILADAAGGAVAKPFYTRGSEERRMALRIAPELWLKRLIIGGFERVYEIGSCFRNEGRGFVFPRLMAQY